MRLNHLPVSDTRLMHESQIGFANFILEKNHKISNSSCLQKLGKISAGLIFLSSKKFGVCLTTFRNNKVLLNNISYPLSNKLLTGTNIPMTLKISSKKKTDAYDSSYGFMEQNLCDVRGEIIY
jgi:hypothetical protein